MPVYGDEQKPASETSSLAFGNRLRDRIRKLGLSHSEIARRLEITPQRLSHYVNGTREPELELLFRISSVLRTTVDELLGPSWPLLPVDRDSHLANRELAEYCARLTPEETRVLANLALYLSSEHRTGEDASIGAPLPMRAVADVHERLIPSIIRTLDPASIITEAFFPPRIADKDVAKQAVNIAIVMDFPADQSVQKIERAIRELVAERLRGTHMAIRSLMPREGNPLQHINLILEYSDPKQS